MARLALALLCAAMGCDAPNPAYRPEKVGAGEDAARMMAADGGNVPLPDTRGVEPDGLAPLMHYDFETGTEGWKDIRFEFYRVPEIKVRTSTARAHHGSNALEMVLTTPNKDVLPTFGLDASAIASRLVAGTRIRQWVWFPVGSNLLGVQGFVYYHQRGNPRPIWGGRLTVIEALVAGAWNAIDHQVPDDVDLGAGGVREVGLEWNGRVALTQPLTVYVDDVTITPP